MQHKTFQVRLKADAQTATTGEFTGYASVFDNVDSYGDIVRKGAFIETLADWSSKENRKIPLLYGHDMSDPNNNIGMVIEAEEDDHGLKVRCQIDLEGGNGPQVYRLVKGGRLGEMSFAYDVMDAGQVTEDGETYNELRVLKLYEVSLVPIGANPQTELLDIKSRYTKSDLLAARDLIDAAIGGMLLPEDEAKASAAGPAKSDEEPRGAKSDEEPSRKASAQAILLNVIEQI